MAVGEKPSRAEPKPSERSRADPSGAEWPANAFGATRQLFADNSKALILGDCFAERLFHAWTIVCGASLLLFSFFRTINLRPEFFGAKLTEVSDFKLLGSANFHVEIKVQSLAMPVFPSDDVSFLL